ncbi:MAG: glycosyltransferase family 4 protein [Oscillospiraceae bacterium]|nr:glycosyltransferase family 4 protein [Oscillospiraceae bacterium]
MKVLYIGSEAQATGASFSLAKLIEEEEKLGIEVVPVVHKGNTDQLLNEMGKEHYVVNAWSWMVGKDDSIIKVVAYRIIKGLLNIPCYFQYKKIIKKENPDLVHINALTTYTGAQAAIGCRKFFVWHIREMMEEDLNGRFWSKKQAHSLMNEATCLIAISKCVKTKYQKVVGEQKIRCIYNGIDKNLFYNKDHIVLNGEKIIITMAGRITREKGQFMCLKELLPILKENSNVVLQFAGIGNDYETKKLIDLRDSSGLTDSQVRFLGFVKDMAQLWAETDIAVVYSKFEAFGRVTVEAKMAGALVVGFDSGGTSELINDGVDGYLFNEDEKNLSSVVKFILLNKRISSEIAKNGREAASQIFTSENNAKQIYQLYQEILKK